jgi:hypothetical protein
MHQVEAMDMPARSRGAALLILLAIVSAGVLFAFVAGLNRSSGDLARARAQKTTAALAQAKDALIAYAVTYKDTHDNPGGGSYTVPGYLPCPDPGGGAEGVAAGNCGASLVSVMGRLPWRTLGLDALKDGSGECLWYAVSGTYKNNPNGVSGSTTTSNMMNWDTNGQFDVMDTNGTTFLAGSATDASADAVAVIFAPGAALSGQDRTPAAGTTACGGNYTAAAYLETANGINNSTLVTPSSPAKVTDTSTFIAGTGSSTFNDQLIYITRADIWNAIKKRSDFNNYLRALTRLTAECTAMYGAQNSLSPTDNRLPWASNVSLSGTSIPTYAVNASYNDTANLNSGRLSFKVNTARTSTTNNISSAISDWGTNSAYIFTNSSYCSYTADQKIWYENWKDQLFYAVAGSFDPGGNWWSQACGTCLRVKVDAATLGTNYAAVVIFAGEKLSGQNRNTATDKGTVANYLEGSSPASIAANTGGGAAFPYQVSLSGSFNDIVYAVDTNRAVKCYNGAAMVSVPAAAVAPPGNPAAYGACP